jgi:hypothetical protein
MDTAQSFSFPLDRAGLPLGLPVLSGHRVDGLFAGARPVGELGPFRLLVQGDWLVGIASLSAHAGLEEAARLAYRALIRSAEGKHLCRIWNYVPGINAAGPGGTENYQAFCQGRARAFEEAYGAGFTARLPAATGIGTDGERLIVAFAAHTRTPRHLENPEQAPAWAYPARYGPRAPCFARATILPGQAGDDVFISGTAAIRGHATVAPGDTRAPLEVTVENLDRMAAVSGAGPTAAQAAGAARFVRVYLRDARDRDMTEAFLREGLLCPGDHVSTLRADICRADLTVEIELTVLGARGSA